MLIAEAVMLVLLEPESGKPKVDLIRLDTVLGGALTFDLELWGLLTTTNTGPFGNLRVTATRTASGEIVVIPESLAQNFLITQGVAIAAAKSHNGPRLVGKLGRDVQTTVLQRFVDEGIVASRPEPRWLGLVTLPRWPVIDRSLLAGLNQQVYDAIVGDQTPDPQTRALIALLHCLDVTHQVVPLGDLTRAEVRARAKQLVGKHWITSAVRALVAAQMPG
jgi:hypothetical protein